MKPKWRPSARENINGLSLTPRRKLQNQDARIKRRKVTFDPTIAHDGDLKVYFQIFTQPGAVCHNPALRLMQPANIIKNHTTVYTEGACTIDDIGKISAGSGIWYAQGDALPASNTKQTSTPTA